MNWLQRSLAPPDDGRFNVLIQAHARCTSLCVDDNESAQFRLPRFSLISKMEQPSVLTIRSSRISRLPIPQAPGRSRDKTEPAEYVLKSRIAPRSGSQSAINPIGSAMHEPKSAAKPEQPATSGLEDKLGQNLELNDADPTNYAKAAKLSRRPRPSLSDRTIETLSQIPPSPSPRRRRSSFFPPESPLQPTSRPGSSLNRSRPGTSHGQHPSLPSGFPTPRPASPTKRHLASRSGNQISNVTPSRRSVSSYAPKSLPKSTASVYGAVESSPSKSKAPVPINPSWAENKNVDHGPKQPLRPVRASKTLAARPLKQRPSVQDAFAKPPAKVSGLVLKQCGKIPSTASSTLSIESSDAFSPPSKISSQTLSGSAEPTSTPSRLNGSSKSPSSSATLRETIAKAKAARQKAHKMQDKATFKAKEKLDVFTEIEIGGDNAGLLRKRVATARTDGRLNIAALELKEIPNEVMNMYNANLGDGAWYESVDLVRLVAADNEFEHLSDTVFPDEVAGQHKDDDGYQGNLFAGLETLDLHGNHLMTLPVGLRKLECLTTLSLSKNKLGNDSLQVMGQILSLRELRLAENALDRLSDVFTLHGLEVLDLHDNAISVLPSDIRRLSNLRVLNVSGNKMGSLPFEYLTPLVELDAARNRLSGPLLPTPIDLPNLKSLNVANNALTSMIVHGTVRFPSLQSLDITENRLQDFPDVSGWTNLLTLTAGGNKLSALPEGFTSLSRLRTVDFAMNSIRILDERVGFMESLTVLRVANNPLRERKFLTMDTHELKLDLKARLLPEDSDEKAGQEPLDLDTVGLLPARSGMGIPTWPIKTGGILDRSSTKLETIASSDLEPLLASGNIKSLVLHHNHLSSIPQTINLLAHSLTNLDVSNNRLGSRNYVGEELSLPRLRSLDLSANAINTLIPLLNQLHAPMLADLNISRNRLASLLPLRNTFPSLVSLSAANNSICVLEVDVVRGLQVLNVSGNDIDHLEPKLGLLGAEGLRTLVIGGNRFRVPRRDVVDKGTDAVLTWLRGRIPEGEQ